MSYPKLMRGLEAFFVFLLGFGMFISKPVIYISSSALVLLLVISLLSNSVDRREILAQRWLIAAIGIYFLGVIATLIYPANIADLVFYARKALFLLVFVALWLAYRDGSTRAAALTGILLGFWVAVGLTLYHWPRGDIVTRLPGGTWPVDIWGPLCAFTAAFLLPFTLSRQYGWGARLFFMTTVATALIFMLLSGSRAPMLGLFISISAYLLFSHRRLLLVLLASLVVLYWPAKLIWPNQIMQIQSRIESIDYRHPDVSGQTRLQLWQLSLAQDKEKWHTNPLVLLFGSGPENHRTEIKAFFNSTNTLTEDVKKRLAQDAYPSNDVHNMYLDSIAKMGLIWTAAAIIFLIGLLVLCWRRRKTSHELSLAGALVMSTFIVTGFFYDALLHFNSVFMIFFVTLALAQNPTDTAVKNLQAQTA